MVRIVFPTNEKMSYISKLDASFDKSQYLTILNVTGQNINSCWDNQKSLYWFYGFNNKDMWRE